MSGHRAIYSTLREHLGEIPEDPKKYFFLEGQEYFDIENKTDEAIKQKLIALLVRLINFCNDTMLWEQLTDDQRSEIYGDLFSIYKSFSGSDKVKETPKKLKPSHMIKLANNCIVNLSASQENEPLSHSQRARCCKFMSTLEAFLAWFARPRRKSRLSSGLTSTVTINQRYKKDYYTEISPFSVEGATTIENTILSAKPMKGLDDIEHELRKEGRRVGLVVSAVLEKEVAHQTGFFAQNHMTPSDWIRRDIKQIMIPVKDHHAEIVDEGDRCNPMEPTQRNVKLLELVQEAYECVKRNEVVIFHCNAGKGRSGMLMALFNLVRHLHEKNLWEQAEKKDFLYQELDKVYEAIKVQRPSVSYRALTEEQKERLFEEETKGSSSPRRSVKSHFIECDDDANFMRIKQIVDFVVESLPSLKQGMQKIDNKQDKRQLRVEF